MAPILAAVLLLALWFAGTVVDRISTESVHGSPASVQLVLAVEPEEVIGSTDIRVELSIKNKGQKPVVVQFVGPTRYELSVYANGEKVWSLSQVTGSRGIEAFTLHPEQTRTYSVNWNLKNEAGQTLEPGTYRVNANFYGEWPGHKGRMEMQPVTFLIR